MFKFCNFFLESDKTKGLFPLIDNQHNMKARNTETYQVNYANTDRL